MDVNHYYAYKFLKEDTSIVTNFNKVNNYWIGIDWGLLST